MRRLIGSPRGRFCLLLNVLMVVHFAQLPNAFAQPDIQNVAIKIEDGQFYDDKIPDHVIAQVNEKLAEILSKQPGFKVIDRKTDKTSYIDAMVVGTMNVFTEKGKAIADKTSDKAVDTISSMISKGETATVTIKVPDPPHEAPNRKQRIISLDLRYVTMELGEIKCAVQGQTALKSVTWPKDKNGLSSEAFQSSPTGIALNKVLESTIKDLIAKRPNDAIWYR